MLPPREATKQRRLRISVMKDKHRHCGYCGAAYDALDWPRLCAACGQTTWRNPAPVAVLVVPVDDGVVVIRRGIPPQLGKLALPGGFIDHGESWQAAAARELREECGIELAADRIRMLDVRSPPDGTLVIVFGEAPRLTAADLAPWEANDEVLERLVIRAPTELAFPLHTDVLRAYFERRG